MESQEILIARLVRSTRDENHVGKIGLVDCAELCHEETRKSRVEVPFGFECPAGDSRFVCLDRCLNDPFEVSITAEIETASGIVGSELHLFSFDSDLIRAIGETCKRDGRRNVFNEREG